jgi:MFS family permease
MATGLAIMGFGGGAMIGTPLADVLMRSFASSTSVGVWQTFVVLGTIYFAAMMAGAFGYRLPPPGWAPAGWIAPPASVPATGSHSVPVQTAWTTPQFWLLWSVLCLNVSAGIGVLGMASPMIQEMFQGRVSASAAAGFTGLLSLFNIGGRIAWASLSDHIGRKATYAVFFLLGIVLYASIPSLAAAGNLALFVAAFCLILTMYGGGFATIPAYLADLFGVGHVSAIHGRLLTAWSTAGILGPVLVNYIREFQIARGVAAADAYTFTLYILAGFLAVGLVCNLAVRRVPDRYFTLVATETPGIGAAAADPKVTTTWGLTVAAWVLVGMPLAWGVMRTLGLAAQLF